MKKYITLLLLTVNIPPLYTMHLHYSPDLNHSPLIEHLEMCAATNQYAPPSTNSIHHITLKHYPIITIGSFQNNSDEKAALIIANNPHALDNTATCFLPDLHIKENRHTVNVHCWHFLESNSSTARPIIFNNSTHEILLMTKLCSVRLYIATDINQITVDIHGSIYISYENGQKSCISPN